MGAFRNDDSDRSWIEILEDSAGVPGVQQTVAEDRICDCADMPPAPAVLHTRGTIMILSQLKAARH